MGINKTALKMINYKVTITKDNKVIDEYTKDVEHGNQIEFHVESLRIILPEYKIKAERIL